MADFKEPGPDRNDPSRRDDPAQPGAPDPRDEGGTGGMRSVMRKKRQGGYSLVELLAVIAVLLIIAALAVPQILGMRDKAKGKDCDRLFHALDSEMHNALDDLIFTSTEVIDIVLKAHRDETRNPRNKSEPVFVQTFNASGPNYVDPAAVESCQVVFSGADVLSVKAEQARDPTDEGGGERTFTIGLQ